MFGLSILDHSVIFIKMAKICCQWLNSACKGTDMNKTIKYIDIIFSFNALK